MKFLLRLVVSIVSWIIVLVITATPLIIEQVFVRKFTHGLVYPDSVCGRDRFCNADLSGWHGILQAVA